VSRRTPAQRGTSMFDSLIVPWPRSSLKMSCSLSPSCENIMLVRLESTRVHVGDASSRLRTFTKIVSARRRNQHVDACAWNHHRSTISSASPRVLAGRRWCARGSRIDAEGPVRLGPFASDFALKSPCTSFRRNFCVTSDMKPFRFRIVTRRNDTESAHAHLHAAGFDCAEPTEARFERGAPCARFRRPLVGSRD
jgi:hypothetical protein